MTSLSTTRCRPLWLACVAMLPTVAMLTGCAIEWTNPQARQEIVAAEKTPGIVYTGWRVFQNRCASCHGVDATGSGNAPNLLDKVGPMGPKQFAALMLTRYDWNFSADVDRVVKREQGGLLMPVWQDEPAVAAHIMDLHAYLSARADGKQGPGRPQP